MKYGLRGCLRFLGILVRRGVKEKFFRPLNFVNMLLDFSPQRDIQDDPMKQVE